jgi:hypothetical protein
MFGCSMVALLLVVVGILGLLAFVLWDNSNYTPWLPMRQVLPTSELVVVGQVIEGYQGTHMRVSEVLHGELPAGERELVFGYLPHDDADKSWQGIWWEGSWVLAFLREGSDLFGRWDLTTARQGSGISPQHGGSTLEELQPTIEAGRGLLATLALRDGPARRAAEDEWLVACVETGIEGAYKDLLRGSPVARPFLHPPALEHIPIRDVVGELDPGQLDRLIAVLEDDERWHEGESALMLILAAVEDPRIDAVLAGRCRRHCAGEISERYSGYVGRLGQAVRVRLARFEHVAGISSLLADWEAWDAWVQPSEPRRGEGPGVTLRELQDLTLAEGAALLR